MDGIIREGILEILTLLTCEHFSLFSVIFLRKEITTIYLFVLLVQDQ